ncbi:nucleotidyltransferase [Paenibacillus sp. KS-LC4]|uniref:nucleotidyltransferase n=1 Tax=Paenibacillus sp. KS-LC4 TaxID=2979727 RepID=UPI0030D18705
MRTVGLIVEYNPFHNGHRYHLEQSLLASGSDAVVAVMSGHFLQRGEPAVMDKWSRTEAALRGGCDLVIELPVAYATQAAEWFSYGAVALLEATGVVDSFCFGTESGDLAPLMEAASVIAQEPPAFASQLKELLATGVSYPSAYSSAVAAYLGSIGKPEAAAFPFAMPNHTLGLHYLIALARLGGRMEPFTIRREKAAYNQEDVTDSAIASATAIRKQLLLEKQLAGIKPFVPDTTYDVLAREWDAGRSPVSWDSFASPLLHGIVTRSAQQLAELHEITEGLEHRIRKTLPRLKQLQVEHLLAELKTKRYTRTKLQRSLLSILLGHAKSDFTPDKLRSGLQYIRVLGFSEKGKGLLRKMRTAATLPVLLSASAADQPYRYLELDTQATAAYMLAHAGGQQQGALFRDYYAKPIML